MSVIIEFFAAPDAVTAAAALHGGPDAIGEYDALRYGNFDVLSALAEWESVLTGDEHLDYDLDIVAQVDDTRTMVVAMPPRLQAALAAAEPDALPDAALRWARRHGAASPQETATRVAGILHDLAALAREATPQGQTIHCWIC